MSIACPSLPARGHLQKLVSPKTWIQHWNRSCSASYFWGFCSWWWEKHCWLSWTNHWDAIMCKPREEWVKKLLWCPFFLSPPRPLVCAFTCIVKSKLPRALRNVKDTFRIPNSHQAVASSMQWAEVCFLFPFLGTLLNDLLCCHHHWASCTQHPFCSGGFDRRRLYIPGQQHSLAHSQ